MATDLGIYAFDNARTVQEQRLAALEELLDPGTIRCLDHRGVGAGWQCAEIGAGGGSIALWLCRRVGSSGRVLATDIDARILRERCQEPNIEVLEHDVMVDELPPETFDLVHVRLLLAWLPDPAEALRRLVRAVKAGGLVVAEEMDFISVAPDPRLGQADSELFVRAVQASNAALADASGFDCTYGRSLAGEMAEAGLVDCGSEGRATMWRGGEAGGRVWRLTFEQLREPMVASGRVSAGELDRVLALCDDPALSFLSQITVAAWGTRAAG
jgi:SAM-dependent methyltransferase